MNYVDYLYHTVQQTKLIEQCPGSVQIVQYNACGVALNNAGYCIFIFCSQPNDQHSMIYVVCIMLVVHMNRI